MSSVRQLTFLGVPIDCSGARRGDERGVAALREAGLASLPGIRDAGDVPAHMSTTGRDEATGIIAFEDLRQVTRAVRASVGEIIGRGEIPLVVGGDDAYLPGMLAGARDQLGRISLSFIDGHLDATDGASSPTGEAADMDLAIVTGHGPEALAGDLGTSEVVGPEDVVALGSRLEEPWCLMPDGTMVREADLIDARVRVIRAAQIRVDGPAEVGAGVEARLAERGSLWLHIDLDVLDESVMPAVSYPAPDGLSWSDLHDLAVPLISSRRLAGVDVACFNPDLDPGGVLARRVVDLVDQLRHHMRPRQPASA